MGHVYETPGEIAAVGGTQGRVGQTLARSVGGDEVLQRCQPLTEGRLDGHVDDPPLGVAHQSAHSGHLLDLGDVPLRPRDGHNSDAPVIAKVLPHDFFHAIAGLGPSVHGTGVPFVVGHQSQHVLLFVLFHTVVGLGDDILLPQRHLNVVHADGDAGGGRIVEPQRLDPVQGRCGVQMVQFAIELAGQLLEAVLVHDLIARLHLRWQHPVKHHPTQGSGEPPCRLFGVAHHDFSFQVQVGRVAGSLGLVEVGEAHPGALGIGADVSQVVAAQNHVQRGSYQRFAGGW